MSLNDEERSIVVRLQLEKAHANFDQIPLLRDAGYWDNVANSFAIYPKVLIISWCFVRLCSVKTASRLSLRRLNPCF